MVGLVVGTAIDDQKVLWVANCGDTVSALPAPMGDTFKAMNSPFVTDINSIYAGSTYTVSYVPTTSPASWSYSLSGGNKFLVSHHNPDTCTANGEVFLTSTTTAIGTHYTSISPCDDGDNIYPITTVRRTTVRTGRETTAPTRTKQTKTAPTGTVSSGAAPTGPKNVVYWGQNGGGVVENNDLAAYCTNEAGIDIVILSFLYQYGKGFNIPSGTIGQSCSIDTSGQGQQCDELASAIETCKSSGVKIVLSLGGASGAYSLSSQTEAEAIGQNLWDAYGNTRGNGRVPRPFGTTFVDGWDFDIENNSGNQYYKFMIEALRSNFGSDPQNRYIITGAPQCFLPEPNMEEIVTNSQFDYLWIQFFNNPGCSVNGKINYKDWKRIIKNTPSANARIFLGVPAGPLAANGTDRGAIYYLEPTKLADLVAQYRSDSAFGGIMMWAAGFSDRNVNNGCTYAQQAKSILGFGRTC